MNYYLLTFTIYDGEHEYFTYITTQAKSIEEARMKGQAQEHEVDSNPTEEEMTMFDYNDGQTAADLTGYEEITKEEMETLDKLGVAHFYPL